MIAYGIKCKSVGFKSKKISLNILAAVTFLPLQTTPGIAILLRNSKILFLSLFLSDWLFREVT